MSEATVLNCPACGAPAGPEDTVCAYCQAPLATVACPKCFGLAFKGAANCPHCGAALEASSAQEAAEACPGCKAPMEARELGGYAMDVCGRCSSVWIARATFETFCQDHEKQAVIITALPRVVAVPVNSLNQGYRPCPECKQLMNRVNFAQGSGIILDVCQNHGTFFDPDELRRLVAFLQDGGLDRARLRHADVLEVERKRLHAEKVVFTAGMDDSWKRNQSGHSTIGDFIEQGLKRFLFDRLLG